MQKNISKEYKEIVIKYLALLIGICYLANPLQSQISGIFHEVSHLLEAPDIAIVHSTEVGSARLAHHSHEHAVDNDHEHKFIDLLNLIFDSSDDGDQEKSILVDIKFDKHITADRYLEKEIHPVEKNFNFVSNGNNTIEGHLKILEEPPQSFSL